MHPTLCLNPYCSQLTCQVMATSSQGALHVSSCKGEGSWFKAEGQQRLCPSQCSAAEAHTACQFCGKAQLERARSTEPQHAAQPYCS